MELAFTNRRFTSSRGTATSIWSLWQCYLLFNVIIASFFLFCFLLFFVGYIFSREPTHSLRLVFVTARVAPINEIPRTHRTSISIFPIKNLLVCSGRRWSAGIAEMPERGAAERAGFGPRKRVGIRACFRTQHRRRGDRSRRSWRSGFHSTSGHDQYVEQHLDAEGRRIETLKVLPASVLLHFLLFSLAFSSISSCIFEYPRILSNFPLQTAEY